MLNQSLSFLLFNLDGTQCFDAMGYFLCISLYCYVCINVCVFLSRFLHFCLAPQADAKVRRRKAIVMQNHVVAEAQVAMVIAAEINDEVGVTTAAVHEDEAKNVRVTSENATTAVTEIERENEAGARTDEAGTRTEKDEAEVEIETERGDEVLIVMNREEEATGTRKEVETRTGHAADETELLIQRSCFPRLHSCFKCTALYCKGRTFILCTYLLKRFAYVGLL